MHKLHTNEPLELVGCTMPLVFRAASLNLSADQFFDFCGCNSGWRIELTARKEIVIMAPTGGWTGSGNAWLTATFVTWADEEGSGMVFDSDTAFRLPNEAVRSPDVSWVLRERFEALSRKEQDVFPPLCPDFVLELRAASDTLSGLQAKMKEYLQNGPRLVWLINPPRKEVFVYRPRKKVEHLKNPAALSGEKVLPGFTLKLASLWRALGSK